MRVSNFSPLGLESPAIHKVTVHPTGKHSLQAAITFDCISLHNLETLFTQPKTLQSGGSAGSIESMSSNSFLPKATQLTFFCCRCFACFLFFSTECNEDKCRYITWEHKAAGVTMGIDLKPARGIKHHIKVIPTESLSLMTSRRHLWDSCSHVRRLKTQRAKRSYILLLLKKNMSRYFILN